MITLQRIELTGGSHHSQFVKFVHIDVSVILLITFLKVFLKTLSERCRYQMNIMNEFDILFSDYDSVCIHAANRNSLDLRIHYYNRAINYQNIYRKALYINQQQ